MATKDKQTYISLNIKYRKKKKKTTILFIDNNIFKKRIIFYVDIVYSHGNMSLLEVQKSNYLFVMFCIFLVLNV